MSRYEQIVFLEHDSVNQESYLEAIRIFNDDGTEAAINHLSNWHYPGEHDTRDELGAGSTDDVYPGACEQTGYTLTVNTGLDYIGLEYDLEARSIPSCDW